VKSGVNETFLLPGWWQPLRVSYLVWSHRTSSGIIIFSFSLLKLLFGDIQFSGKTALNKALGHLQSFRLCRRWGGPTTRQPDNLCLLVSFTRLCSPQVDYLALELLHHLPAEKVLPKYWKTGT
jgi:hypothetical protein